MRHHRKCVIAGCAAVTAVALAAAVNVGPAGAVTSARRVAFGGNAYGSYAQLGSQVSSGRTAYVPLCTTTAPTSYSDRTAAVAVPGVGTIGAVTTRVTSARTAHTLSSVTTTTTAATSLLGGMVQVKAITTSARVSLTGGTYTSTGSSTLVGLTIAGRAVDNTPKVNQTISIPGVGTVYLNRQTKSASNDQHALTVTALQLVLKVGNTPALPGGNVVVGHATATLHAPTYRSAYGSAYVSSVRVGSSVQSGATAPVYLPCGGGRNGVTLSNKTAAADLTSVVSTGAVTTSASSNDARTVTSATTSSHVASVNLLGGVITLRAVTAVARAERKGSHLTTSSSTELVGLTVNGKKLSIPASSTARTLPGLGTLYVNRATKSSTGIQVYALQVVLSQAVGGAAKGTVIVIGSATAGVRP